MNIWKKLWQSHVKSLRDVKIKDLKIIGKRMISALESIDILTVGDLLDMPSTSPYEALFPRDVYDNIEALQRIALRTSGNNHCNLSCSKGKVRIGGV